MTSNPAQPDINLDQPPLDVQAVLGNIKSETGRHYGDSVVALSIARSEVTALREAANAARAARDEAQATVDRLEATVAEQHGIIGRLQRANAEILARLRVDDAAPEVIDQPPTGAEPIHVVMTDGSVSTDPTD